MLHSCNRVSATGVESGNSSRLETYESPLPNGIFQGNTVAKKNVGTVGQSGIKYRIYDD